MARPANAAQYQRHSLQLISRVLNNRSNASPFTLILDDLNQRAMPLIGEVVRRGLSRNSTVVVVSFEATRFHPAVRSIAAYGDETGEHILQQIRAAMSGVKESLVIVDSLYELISVKNVDMVHFSTLLLANLHRRSSASTIRIPFPIREHTKRTHLSHLTCLSLWPPQSSRASPLLMFLRQKLRESAVYQIRPMDCFKVPRALYNVKMRMTIVASSLKQNSVASLVDQRARPTFYVLLAIWITMRLGWCSLWHSTTRVRYAA